MKKEIKIRLIAVVLITVIALVLLSGIEKLELGVVGSDLNVSYAPFDEFCKDMGMEDTRDCNIIRCRDGCVDTYGEIHHYTVQYEDGIWIIGNKSYVAEWSGAKEATTTTTTTIPKKRVLKEYFVNDNYTSWTTCLLVDSFGESHVLETTNSSDCDKFFSKYPKYRSKGESYEMIYYCPEGYESMTWYEAGYLDCLAKGNEDCNYWDCTVCSKNRCALVVEE